MLLIINHRAYVFLPILQLSLQKITRQNHLRHTCLNPQAASNFCALQEKCNNFCISMPILDLNIQKFAHDIELSTEQLRLAP